MYLNMMTNIAMVTMLFELSSLIVLLEEQFVLQAMCVHCLHLTSRHYLKLN